jgi:hypothetical protein
MAFVPGYENDIFISYSHTDNDPMIENRRGWVDFFEDVLRKRIRLRMENGRELEIFRDTQLRQFGKFPDQLAKQISGSAVFLCILSPSYFGSEWCLRELKEFCATGGTDRIIKIVKTAFDVPAKEPGMSLHEQIKDILHCEFYKKDESSGFLKDLQPEVIPNDVPEAIEKIEVVAQNLVMLLQRLHTSQSATHTTGQPQPQPVEKPPANEAEITVYLAETTKDLSKTRDEVRTELLQFNCRVLPDQPLPGEVDKLSETIETYLEQAKLSVHLLGPNYGAIPEMEERSVPHLQYDLARQVSGKGNLSQLVWMPNGLELSDRRQLQFIEAVKNNSTDLLSSRIEDLKTEIRKKLSVDSKNPWGDEPNGSINVSLFCHEQDVQSVRPLYSYLTMDQLFRVKLPLKDADSFQTHKELLQTSDAVLLYYGTADEDWFVNIWRLIQRQTSSGRNKPVLAKAIYAGQPPTMEKNLLESDDPIIIKNFGPFNPQSLTPFLQRIRNGRGGSQ